MESTQNKQQTRKETAAGTQPQQQSPEIAKPQQEHRWLQKLVGDWIYEGEAPMGPDETPTKFSGTESFRSLGDLWVVGEGQGEMPGGGEATTLLTLGYDPQKKSYVGTWIGTMMTQLWVYDRGEVEGDRKLILHSEGPTMPPTGELTEYREVIEFQGDDKRTFTSHMRAKDGSWQPMMTATYRRRGKGTH
jgi:hypothetical protein